MLANDFVLRPDRYLLPAYRISPFATADIAANRNLPTAASADDYFRARFPGRRFVYCESGRQAIRLALLSLKPGAEDVVTILTTTGNHYISGCVTREIEKVCRWSRRSEPATKVLLVNHEFGFGYTKLQALRQQGWPIIEDAAHAFASDNAEQSLGRVGRCTVFSFPKFFPVQIGALLVFDEACEIPEPVDPACKRYLQKVISFYLDSLDSICRRRLENYRSLAARFQRLGCPPRFELEPRSIPGVFMAKAPSALDLPSLKTFLWDHGIENSVFYGEQAFFFPVHQRLREDDLDYFFEVARCFFEKS